VNDQLLDNAEFSVGDTVHFRAYKYQPEEGLPAKVKKVARAVWGGVIYHISGDVISVTTGRSLVESKLFEPPTE
jgi:hypothetical protein